MAKPKLSMTAAIKSKSSTIASGVDPRHAIAASYGMQPERKDDGTTWKQTYWTTRDGKSVKESSPIYWINDGTGNGAEYYIIFDGQPVNLKDIADGWTRAENPTIWTESRLPADKDFAIRKFNYNRY